MHSFLGLQSGGHTRTNVTSKHHFLAIRFGAGYVQYARRFSRRVSLQNDNGAILEVHAEATVRTSKGSMIGSFSTRYLVLFKYLIRLAAGMLLLGRSWSLGVETLRGKKERAVTRQRRIVGATDFYFACHICHSTPQKHLIYEMSPKMTRTLSIIMLFSRDVFLPPLPCIKNN